MESQSANAVPAGASANEHSQGLTASSTASSGSTLSLPASYSIAFVPFTALLTKDDRNKFIRFCAWIDSNHGDTFATKNAFSLVKALNNPYTSIMTSSMLQCVFYIVLAYEGKPVCAALFQKGMEITTLTTVKSERKKGHATVLMTFWRQYCEKWGVMTICPAEERIMNMLKGAGWTPCYEQTNPDGTHDTMPEYVKSEYKRTTKCRPMRPLQERSADRCVMMLDHLERIAAPVPDV